MDASGVVAGAKQVVTNEEDVEVCTRNTHIKLSKKADCMRRQQKYTPALPVVSFRFSDDFKQKYPDIQQKWMQTLLRAKGW